MNEISVNTDSAMNTVKYALIRMSWLASCVVACPVSGSVISSSPLGAITLYQIQQGEQEDPHNIDKVPIQSGHFQHGGMLRSQPADHGHEQDDGENHDAAENVQRVKAGHGEVARRPQVAKGNGRRQMQFGMVLFLRALEDFVDALSDLVGVERAIVLPSLALIRRTVHVVKQLGTLFLQLGIYRAIPNRHELFVNATKILHADRMLVLVALNSEHLLRRGVFGQPGLFLIGRQTLADVAGDDVVLELGVVLVSLDDEEHRAQ